MARASLLLLAAWGCAQLLPLDFCSAPAHAQVRMTATRTIGGPGGDGQISKRAVDRYSRILGLDDAQRGAVADVYEGYRAAYGKARSAQNEKTAEIIRASQEGDEPELVPERLPAVQKEFEDATKGLESGFFGDVRALLTAEQEALWPRVERSRRREVGLRGGVVSGDGVDLVEVVEGLELGDAAGDELGEALSQYEADMDRQLAARDAIVKDLKPIEPGRLRMEEVREHLAKSREGAVKVRDCNDRHARKIEGVLPEEKRPVFNEEVKRRTYTQVYRAWGAERAFEATAGFADLSPEQREEITGLRERYRREAAAANEAWVAAIREQESTGEGTNGSLPMAGGGTMVLALPDEKPDATTEARKARREVDERATAALREILTPEQRERLPKAQPASEGEGRARVLRRGP